MRYILIFVLMLTVLLAQDNLSIRLDKLIQEKSVKKVAMVKYDPFLIKKEIKTEVKKANISKKKTQKKELMLISIFGDRAFIDGSWVKKNDHIRGYKVVEIKKKSILLSRNHKILVLKFKKSKEILKVREK